MITEGQRASLSPAMLLLQPEAIAALVVLRRNVM
jgi:hypothetical protein